MKKRISSLIILLLLSNCSLLYGQKKALIGLIKTYCKMILIDSTKKVVTLGEEELGKRGGNLTGYFSADSLVQIGWFNNPESIIQTDYFYRDGSFICSQSANRKPENKEKNANNKKVAFRESYYYVNKKMYRIDSYRNKIRKVKNKTKEYILQTALEYKLLIFKYKK